MQAYTAQYNAGCKPAVHRGLDIDVPYGHTEPKRLDVALDTTHYPFRPSPPQFIGWVVAGS